MRRIIFKMSDELDAPEEEKVSGRLRAEDRRGRMMDDLLIDHSAEGPILTDDPEEAWEEAEVSRYRRWIMQGLSAIIAIGLFAVIFNSLMVVEEPKPVPIQIIQKVVLFHESASVEEIEAEAERVVEAFMMSSDDRARCAHILGGKDRLHQLQGYYRREGHAPPSGYGGKIKVEPYALEGEALFAAVASDPDSKKFWIFHLRSTETGLLIDWEASVAYGDLSWDDFLSDQPQTPVVMRVYLTGVLAPPELGIDDEEFRTFEVSFRGSTKKTIISLKRGSAIEKELAQMVPLSAPHPVTLYFRWTEDELTIIQVLHNYWVRPAKE